MDPGDAGLGQRTADIIVESLRGGEVPQEGLEHFATGIEAHVAAFDRELERVADRRGRYRFVRGGYGSGKTFFLRHLGARARAKGFATAYVRVSYPEVPLHRPAAIYRAAAAGLGVGERADGALRDVVEQWLFEIGERVVDPRIGRGIADTDPGFPQAVADEVRTVLGPVADAAPAMAQALAGYARASLAGQHDVARGLLQWLGGDEKVAAGAKREALLTGTLGHTDALPMLRGLSELVRQAGYRGLVVLLDEVERMLAVPRGDARHAALETLQNWVGALEAGQLPGVLLVVAGTPRFYTSRRGVPALEPLQQRIGAFDDGPYPDLDAIQIALPAFDARRLVEVGRKVRSIYEMAHPETAGRLDPAFLERLAELLVGAFGGDASVAPRRFLRELVTVLGRVRQYPDYDPLASYAFDRSGGGLALDVTERAVLEGRDAGAAEETPLPEGFDL